VKLVGAHVSAKGGVENAPVNAKAIGASAFAMFTKSRRRWKAKPLDSKSIDAFHRNMTAGDRRGYPTRAVHVCDGRIGLGVPAVVRGGGIAMPRSYATPLTFKTAVEQRLRNEAEASGEEP
jgi:hypothetical protein